MDQFGTGCKYLSRTGCKYLSGNNLPWMPLVSAGFIVVSQARCLGVTGVCP